MSQKRILDIDATIRAALAARDAGLGDKAIVMIRDAIQSHPSEPRLWQALGTVYRALEESAKARSAFAEALRLAPYDTKAAYGVAQSTLEAGLPAISMFDRARLLAPMDGSLILGRAAAQLAEGKIDQAISDLGVLVASNPLWFEGHLGLARLQRLAGENDSIGRSYEVALRQLPDNADLWLEYINLYIRAEDYLCAKQILDRALQAGCDGHAFTLWHAVCASELGDLERADSLFTMLGNGPNIVLAERRIRHLLRARRPAEAVELAKPYLGQPNDNWIWPYVSLAWRQLDDPQIEWLEGGDNLIGVYDLPVSTEFLASLGECLRPLHLNSSNPLGQSVRKGTQTDGPLFAREEPEIQELRALIVETVAMYSSRLGAVDTKHPTKRHIGKPFRFAGSWSVRLTGAGHHSNHIHPQGWLSSAFYVAVPAQQEMGPPPAGALSFGLPPTELNLEMPPYRTVVPQAGRLALFPSTMWHGTAPLLAGERLTVAFDVAAIG